MGVEGPELLILLGFVLLVIGSLVAFLALLKAFYSGERAPQRAVGLVLIGPFPVFVAGRSAKLVLAIVLVSLAIILAALLFSWAVASP